VTKNIVLALPTTHDVHTPLRLQFGDTNIHVLTNHGTFRLTQKNLNKIRQEIEEAVRQLPEARYALIVQGLCVTNIIAYHALKERFGRVETLTFDGRQKRYVKHTL